MNFSINLHKQNASTHPTNTFYIDPQSASKLIVNGKSIDMTTKEAPLPDYLQKLRQLNEDTKYEQLLQRVQSGEDLTPTELTYLKDKNPTLYQEVLQEIRMQKQFEQQLKHCKTKDDAHKLYLGHQITAAKMCGSPCGKASTIPKDQQQRYNRIMNRINKSYQKYLNGELEDSPGHYYDAQV